jgi:hypothetical protein
MAGHGLGSGVGGTGRLEVRVREAHRHHCVHVRGRPGDVLRRSRAGSPDQGGGGVTEGWIDRVERGDPKVVTFVTIGEDNVDGDFLADPSLRARAGAQVRLRFERRGTIRWITDVSERADKD